MKRLELRIYNRCGDKQFIYFDLEIFLEKLNELKDLPEDAKANATIEIALEEALINPNETPVSFDMEFMRRKAYKVK